MTNPAPLREDLQVGDLGHVSDHEQIAATMLTKAAASATYLPKTDAPKLYAPALHFQVGVNPITAKSHFLPQSRRDFAAGQDRAHAELREPLATGVTVTIGAPTAFANEPDQYAAYTEYGAPTAQNNGATAAWPYPGNNSFHTFPAPGTPLPSIRAYGTRLITSDNVAFNPGVKTALTGGTKPNGEPRTGPQPHAFAAFHTGKKVVFGLGSLAGNGFRMKVDGRYVTRDPLVVSQDLHAVSFTFPTRARREIVIETVGSLGLAYLQLEPDGILEATPAPSGPTIYGLGDSWMDGAGVDRQGWEGMAQVFAKGLGSEDYFHASAGGTGYVTGEANYRRRAEADWPLILQTAGQPDLAVIYGSQNDNGQNPAAVQENAAAVYALIAPTPILVVHGSPTLGFQTVQAPQKAAVQAAAAAAPNVIDFLDLTVLMTQANEQALLFSDGAHPSKLAHEWYGRVIAARVRQLAGLPR